MCFPSENQEFWYVIARGCLCYKPTVKNLVTKSLMNELPWYTTFHVCCCNSPYVTPLEKDSWKLLNLTSFPLADFILYLSLKYITAVNMAVWWVLWALLKKSLNLRVALEIPMYHPLPYQAGFHFQHLPLLTLHFLPGKTLTSIVSAITFILSPPMLNSTWLQLP